MTLLIQYPAGGNSSYVIPDSVTVIESGIFGWQNPPITELVIGNGVEEIYEAAFIDCDNLETVYTDNAYVAGWFAENMPDVEVRPLAVTQTLSLTAGWNWVSFHVLPESKKLSEVIGTQGFTLNDTIQTDTGSARFSGSSWIPGSFTLDYGKLYQIHVAQDMTVTITGQASDSAAVTVKAGWNWIANPTATAVTPSQLSHSAGWTMNDRILSNVSSVTFSGSKWIPSSGFTLEPGRGYLLYSAKAGTVTFGGDE